MNKTVKFTLHPHWKQHTGHCQITYVSKNADGQKIVHCLQQNFGDVRLMRCSQDGEPNYEIKIPENFKFVFEKVPGDDELAIKANEWIDTNNKNEVQMGYTGLRMKTNNQLLDLLTGAESLKRLHSEKGGLEQHKKHSEEQIERIKGEILRRMKDCEVF